MLCTKLFFVLYRLIGTDKPQVLEGQQSHFAPLHEKYADFGFNRVCWKNMLCLICPKITFLKPYETHSDTFRANGGQQKNRSASCTVNQTVK